MTEEATPEVASSVSVEEAPIKRGKRGRPKGAKTRPLEERAAEHLEELQRQRLGLTQKEIQRQVITAAFIGGASKSAIAEEMGVTRRTISNVLTTVEKSEAVQRARGVVLGVLLPRALNVLDAALGEGNVEVALAIAKGTGVLNEKNPGAGYGEGEGGGSDNFDEWRLQLIRRRSPGDEPPPHDPPHQGSHIQIVSGGLPHTPSAFEASFGVDAGEARDPRG